MIEITLTNEDAIRFLDNETTIASLQEEIRQLRATLEDDIKEDQENDGYSIEEVKPFIYDVDRMKQLSDDIDKEPVPKSKNKPWKSFEDSFITSSVGRTTEDIAKSIKRTTVSVAGRARRLGMSVKKGVLQ